VTSNAGLLNEYDVDASFGGRIIRDKLWFFLDERQLSRVFNVPSYLGQDRVDNPTHTFKLSDQLTSKYKLIGYLSQSVKHEYDRGASAFIPFQSTYNYLYNPHPAKLEFQGIPSSSVLVDAQVDWFGYSAQYYSQAGIETPGDPLRLDIATRIMNGGTASNLQGVGTWEYSGSVTLVPKKRFLNGQHEFKVGFLYRDSRDWWHFPNRANGNYELIYNKGVPFEIDFENRPVDWDTVGRNPAVYAKDTWRIGRVTADLGLRFERYAAVADSLTQPASPTGPGGIVPEINVIGVNSFAPRLGAAWDLRGNGRSVLKGQWGRFHHNIDAFFASNYSTAYRTYQYLWHAPVGTADYTPGQVNLNPNGPDFVGLVSSLANTAPSNINGVINPNLKDPYTDETTIAFEQQIAGGFAVRALGVYKTVNALYFPINGLRPISAWNIPVQRQAPDGSIVQLYDYSPAYTGINFVNSIYTNATNANSYKGFEFSAIKRQSSLWSLTASFQMLKDHVWLGNSASPASPNDLLFPLDETWDWSGKVYGSYRAPLDFQVSGIFNFLRGTPGQQTYTFTKTDPLGGTCWCQVASLNVPVGTYGAVRNPPQKVLNLKLARPLPLGKARLTLALQVFNVLNDNTPTTISYVEGPTFGAISAVTPPRVVMFGGEFTF
jgi:hypothetical protein